MTLNDFNKQSLFNFLAEILSASPLSMMECRESRFSKGQVCPHCEGTHVIKYGMIKSQQRYQCKTCHRTFTDFTKSALSHSHLPLTTWLEYTKCMILGLSIRKSAERVNVSVKTSFYMRHKILDAIRLFLGVGNLEGIIEMDETFFPLSFKGNHKKSGFEMPRPARKRGKQVNKRGISNEQVCIATAIDRNGNIILEPLCKGRVTYNALERLYEGRIDSNSIICTDSHKSYIQFAKNLELDHKKIARGHYKNDIYHINHVNSLHSNLKIWMYRFKGVSTKFLQNYMSWYKWLQSFNNDKEVIKTKNMLIHSIIPFVDTKIKGYKERKAVFI